MSLKHAKLQAVAVLSIGLAMGFIGPLTAQEAGSSITAPAVLQQQQAAQVVQLSQHGGPYYSLALSRRMFNDSTSHDPEMIKLIQADQDAEQRASQLAQQIRKGKPEQEGVDQKAELGKLVNQHFDVRQKRRELELKRLEEQLSHLREVIKRRNDSRDLIVGKRLPQSFAVFFAA